MTDENGKPVHEEINTVPFRFQIKILPDHAYMLKVSGTEGKTVEGSVVGVITPKFTG